MPNNWIERPLSAENQAKWDALKDSAAKGTFMAAPADQGRGSFTGALAPKIDDEFIGTATGAGPRELGGPGEAGGWGDDRPTAESAYHQFVLDQRPGGRFANASPRQLAEHRATLLQAFGAEPAPVDEYDIMRERVEHRFSVGCEVTPEWAAVLDAQLNAIKDDEIPMYTDRAKAEMGVEAYSDAIISANRVLGADEMKDGRVASNAYALKYLRSIDVQRSKRDAAFARLPKRPAK